MSFRQDLEHVLSLVSNGKKRKKTIEIIMEYEEKIATGKGSDSGHHNYDGGLADHLILVSLLANHMAKKLPDFLYFTCNIDDVIISSLFHDFDKIDKYPNPDDRKFPTPLDIYALLVDNGLSSKGIRDGVLHAHGGWSQYKDEPYGMTAIIVHAADMIASHVIMEKPETEKAISAFFKEIDDPA